MPLLEVSAVRARYGAIEALKGVSLTVGEGEVVTLIGSNGAGKSTTLRSICRADPGRRRHGSPSTGEDITGVPADEIVTRGIALSPEGRRCFARMTRAGEPGPRRLPAARTPRRSPRTWSGSSRCSRG